MDLRGKKIAVLVADQYQELEVWYPLLRFREDGAETDAIGAEAGSTYLSKKGYPVVANRSIADVHVDEYDAIIVPGGWAPDTLRQDSRVLKFVREMHRWVLASADIVKGVRATCFKAIKDDLIHAGAAYEDTEVVVDGNIISSRVPTDLPAFCREIARALAAEPVGARKAGKG
jgi:protease I